MPHRICGAAIILKLTMDNAQLTIMVSPSAMIEKLTAEMREAAKALEFEKAAYLRDKIKELKAGK